MFKKIVLLFIFLITYLFCANSTFASVLYLSPGSGTLSKGGVTSVQIRLNTSGDAINAVSAYLSYPADKVDVSWVNTGSSVFGIDAEKAFGGGFIKISRGNISGVTGDVHVATIGLKGKTEGEVMLSFVGGSAAPRATDGSDSLNLAASRGGLYMVKTIPQVTKGSGIAPKISNVVISDITKSSVVISWQTNVKSDSLVEYGFDKGRYILNVIDNAQVTDHKLKIESPLLVAGETFHFRMKSKDSGGNEGFSDDYSFHLLGYPVTVKVVDNKSRPIPDVKVLFYDTVQEGTTDKNGQVVFQDVSPRKHLVVMKLQGAEKTVEIEIVESNDMQIFNLIFPSMATLGLSFKPMLPLFAIAVAVLLLILAFIAIRIKRKKISQ